MMALTNERLGVKTVFWRQLCVILFEITWQSRIMLCIYTESALSL